MSPRSKAPAARRWLCLTIAAIVILGLAPGTLAATPTKPDAPVLGTPVAGTRQVTLTWSEPDDGGTSISDYRIQYRLATETAWLPFPDGVSTTRTTVVAPLTAGLAYDFRVRARNIIGWGPPSNVVSATPTGPAVPAQVLNLSATAGPGAGEVSLTWDAVTGPGIIDDYRIQYRLTTETAWLPFPDGVSIATSAVVPHLTPDKEYAFRVRAHNAAGLGKWSSIDTAIPPASSPATKPGKPTDLHAVGGVESAVLTWSAPQVGGVADPSITDYRVQYRLTTEADWTTFTDGISDDTGATVIYLVGNKTYEFQVRARNAEGWGPPSDIATALTTVAATVPSEPLNLTNLAGIRQVTLNWQAPALGAPILEYRVQYRRSDALSWSTFADEDPLDLTATVTWLTEDVTYEFRVKARNAVGWGDPCEPIEAIPLPPEYP